MERKQSNKHIKDMREVIIWNKEHIKKKQVEILSMEKL